jgi:hypothetical protein
MQKLLLKFIIRLEDDNLPLTERHNGPLFHRWLPSGQEDTIVLDTGDPNTKLKIWFERRGFINRGFIEFDYKRREVDPLIIPKQAILDAGPLYGLLEVYGLSKDVLEPLKNNKKGDENYIRLGKRVALKLIYPPVCRFIDILRTNYGQYWIPELRKWDARNESLGNYCHTELNLYWSLDDGTTWADFIPDELTLTFDSGIRRDFHDYLTENDWFEMKKTVQEKYEPELAAFLLSRTHQFFRQGNFKYALIEGVSALEIAINEFIRQKSKDISQSLRDKISAFQGMKLPIKVATIVTFFDLTHTQNLEKTVAAIDMRNDIVHEGKEPPDNDDTEEKIKGLMKTTAALIKGPKFKFPSANTGNAIMSPEKWEQWEQQKN